MILQVEIFPFEPLHQSRFPVLSGSKPDKADFSLSLPVPRQVTETPKYNLNTGPQQQAGESWKLPSLRTAFGFNTVSPAKPLPGTPPEIIWAVALM